MTKQLRLWVWGDAHVGSDLKHGRESLADALRQSESGDSAGAPPFAWDIAIDIGDMSGGQTVPRDDEGEELVRQFKVLRNHRREDVYSVCGNHDRSGLREEPAWWWRKWVDPMGLHTEFSGVHNERRPYPVIGTWERYRFDIGNLTFLMMSDINEPSQTIGRGDLGGKVGGNPSGVVSGETFAWWQRNVAESQGRLVISVHHYMLKDTTVASGEWEGVRRDEDGNWQNHYHGYKPEGTPRGASYLYFVDSVPDAQAFERHLADHPGSVALWLGGHTHTHPDDTHGGKSHVETRWGTHFVNCACLSRYHGHTNVPKSRLFTFTEGNDHVRVQCYMHTAEFLPIGWYAAAERTLTLPRPFLPPGSLK
jgi:hypothetical protein